MSNHFIILTFIANGRNNQNNVISDSLLFHTNSGGSTPLHIAVEKGYLGFNEPLQHAMANEDASLETDKHSVCTVRFLCG